MSLRAARFELGNSWRFGETAQGRRKRGEESSVRYNAIEAPVL